MPVFNVILTVIAIGFLVGIHEFGHFIVAKLIGVRVEVFSIGFWKKIVGWRWGETEYRISLIPFGGYVRLAGEEGPPAKEPAGQPAAAPEADRPEAPAGQTAAEQAAAEPAGPKPYEFFARPPEQRIYVFAAGALMNAVSGVLLFMVAFAVGVHFTVPEVGDTELGSPAWRAGLLPGDRILALDGRRDPDFEDVFRAAALSGKGKRVDLTIGRGDRTFAVSIKPEYSEAQGMERLGIIPPFATRITGLVKLDTPSGEVMPAQEAGLEPGDVIVSVDGRPVADAREVSLILRATGGKPVTIGYLRDGVPATATVRPVPSPRTMLGVSCVTADIEEVAKNSEADRMGLRPHDVIASVDGTNVYSVVEIRDILRKRPDAEHVLTVRRGGETLEFKRTFKDILAVDDFLDGISMTSSSVLTWVQADSPAEAAGLRRGDRILSIGRRQVKSWEDFQRANGEYGKKPRSIQYERDGVTNTVEAAPVLMPDPDRPVLGVVFGDPVRRLRRYGLLKSVREGFYKAGASLEDVILQLRGFVTRRVSTRQVGGIILIAAASYRAAETGIGKLCYMMGLISMGLAFLNLLPIPVLDGGHILFTAIEKIRGRPVSQRVMAVAQYMGLALLLGLIVYATLNDVMRFWLH